MVIHSRAHDSDSASIFFTHLYIFFTHLYIFFTHLYIFFTHLHHLLREFVEHSTIHQAFVLQHVIDKHRCLKTPLYLCFVDLKSAYDRVQWPLLWDLLRRLGVHGKMLGAVQSLYDNCLLFMRVHEGLWLHWGGQNPFYGVAAGLPAQCYPVWLVH